MSEVEPITCIRTSFERVVQSTCGLPQYESARAAVSIEETYPGTLNPDEVAAIVSNHFVHAKGAVFQQLGIGFEQDDTDVLREAFGDVITVASAPASAGQAVVRAAPTTATPAPPAAPAAPPRAPAPPVPRTAAPAPAAPPPPRPPAPAAPASSDDDELWAELMERPDLWLDVRGDKASGKAKHNAPDFRSTYRKEGRYSKGIWLDKAPDWFVDPWG